MKNISDYAMNVKKSFEELEFNEVDALIFSWLAYYCFPDCLKKKSFVTLKELKDCKTFYDNATFSKMFQWRASKKLFNYMAQNERFANVKLSSFCEEYDEENEMQFSAICIEFLPNTYFLAFRGTDPSFVGWKEDFNLAYKYPIPAQKSALEYAKKVMHKHRKGKFYLGGHSKGGNIAVYAAITLPSTLQNKMIKTYCFDGPGFIYDVKSEPNFKNVEQKIIKIVPNSSFVGMLLERENNFSIVKSFAISVFQHDPFTWAVKGQSFCPVNGRTNGSVKLEQAFNKWIDELSIEDRERIIGIVYGALNDLDTKDFNVFFKTFYRQIPALYVKYRKLNVDDKTFFDGQAKRFVSLLRNKVE